MILFKRINDALNSLDKYLKRIALFGVLDKLGKLSILVAALTFLISYPENKRTQERIKDEAKKARIYRAWQVINSAQGQTGSGGRVLAMQELRDEGLSLAGVDVHNAWLAGVNLNGAELSSAKFSGANLENAQLSNANLVNADFKNSYLVKTSFLESNLEGADLSGAELRRTKLAGVNLEKAKLDKSIFDDADMSQVKIDERYISAACISPMTMVSHDILTRTSAETEFMVDFNIKEWGSSYTGSYLSIFRYVAAKIKKDMTEGKEIAKYPAASLLSGNYERPKDCPEPLLFNRIYFEDNKSFISDREQIKLDLFLQFLLDYPETKIVVEGNVDETYTTEYANALGQRLASNVKHYLVTAGISKDRLRLVSFGKERPIDLGHSKDARDKNRRVELRLVEK